MCVQRCLHPPIDFVVEPTNCCLLDFETPTKKPSWWFWGQNHQTVAVCFEAQTRKPVPVVLTPNHWQTVDLHFETKPINLRSSSPSAWCRPHIASSDLLIVRPPSTRSVFDHPRSSASGLLLLPWSSRCPLCRTYHLHTTRQESTILHTR
jgi:hypothetical protein